MVLHLSSDLMLVGKVSSWAKAHDVVYRSVANVEKFAAILDEGEVQRVIIDLQFKSLEVSGVARLVRDCDSGLPLFGYAQHVMTDLIQAANTAGFDRVLTRGQFDHGFASLMTD